MNPPTAPAASAPLPEEDSPELLFEDGAGEHASPEQVSLAQVTLQETMQVQEEVIWTEPDLVVVVVT